MELFKKITFIFSIMILGSASLYFIYSNKLNGPVIRSDGEGYYAYLPAFFIYHDNSLPTQVAGFRKNVPQGASHWENTSKYLIRYPCGEAILLSPFFLLVML